MFFFLSKILAFLLSPFTWLFVALLYLLRKCWHSPFRKLVLGIIVATYMLSNGFLVDEVVRAWEYKSDDIYQGTQTYDLAIILGGMGHVDQCQDKFDFGFSADRLLQPLELYGKGRVKKLMITGGSGSISHPEDKEAPYIRRYLLSLGVPDSKFIIESESKNTRENAVNSKRILDSLHFKGSILFVTSSYHMRRSLGCFHKAGFKGLTPYATNRFTGPRKFEIDYCFIPSLEAFAKLELILHEMAGYAVYKMKGYV